MSSVHCGLTVVHGKRARESLILRSKPGSGSNYIIGLTFGQSLVQGPSFVVQRSTSSQLHRFQTHSARFVTSIIFLDSLAGISSLTPYSLIVSLLRPLPFNNTITRESLGPCMDNSTPGLFFVSYQTTSCPIEPTNFSIKRKNISVNYVVEF